MSNRFDRSQRPNCHPPSRRCDEIFHGWQTSVLRRLRRARSSSRLLCRTLRRLLRRMSASETLPRPNARRARTRTRSPAAAPLSSRQPQRDITPGCTWRQNLPAMGQFSPYWNAKQIDSGSHGHALNRHTVTRKAHGSRTAHGRIPSRKAHASDQTSLIVNSEPPGACIRSSPKGQRGPPSPLRAAALSWSSLLSFGFVSLLAFACWTSGTAHGPQVRR